MNVLLILSLVVSSTPAILLGRGLSRIRPPRIQWPSPYVTYSQQHMSSVASSCQTKPCYSKYTSYVNHDKWAHKFRHQTSLYELNTVWDHQRRDELDDEYDCRCKVLSLNSDYVTIQHFKRKPLLVNETDLMEATENKVKSNDVIETCDDKIKNITQLLGPLELGRTRNYTVVVGENVTLECKLMNVEGYNISWIKVDMKEEMIDISQTNHKNELQLEEVIMKLHFDDAVLEDSGHYDCHIQKDSFINKYRFRLNVVQHEVFILKDNSLDIDDYLISKVEDDVQLHCVVKDMPISMVNVTWYYQPTRNTSPMAIKNDLIKEVRKFVFRDEQKLAVLSTLTVHVLGVRRSDGLYTCKVREMREVVDSYQTASAFLHVLQVF